MYACFSQVSSLLNNKKNKNEKSNNSEPYSYRLNRGV